MKLRRIFSENIPEIGEKLQLSEEETRHAVKVLRLKEGDKILLLDGKGTLAEAELLETAKIKTASCMVITKDFFVAQAPEITLYIAPPHSKSFETILKTAAELGIREITPIICRYGVAKPKNSNKNWQNNLVAACKQAINPWLPKINEIMKFADALKNMQGKAIFGAVPKRKQASKEIFDADNEKFSLWIGPEGGFSTDEEELLLKNNASAVTVGNYVLRIETAVPALTGYILAKFNNN